MFDLDSSEEDYYDENMIQKNNQKCSPQKLSSGHTLFHHWLYRDFQEQLSVLKRNHSSSWWSWWTFTLLLITAQTCPVCLINKYHVSPCTYPLWVPLILPEKIALLSIKSKCFISETDNCERKLLWNDQWQTSENRDHNRQQHCCHPQFWDIGLSVITWERIRNQGKKK